MKLPGAKAAIGYLAAVFLAGAVAGAAGGYYYGVRKAMTPPGPHEFASVMCEKLQTKLHLTPEQMKHIEPIVGDAVSEFRGICTATADQIGAIIQKTNQRIAEFLTPEQKKLLEDMERERQELFRKMFASGETSQ